MRKRNIQGRKFQHRRLPKKKGKKFAGIPKNLIEVDASRAGNLLKVLEPNEMVMRKIIGLGRIDREKIFSNWEPAKVDQMLSVCQNALTVLSEVRRCRSERKPFLLRELPESTLKQVNSLMRELVEMRTDFTRLKLR